MFINYNYDNKRIFSQMDKLLSLSEISDYINNNSEKNLNYVQDILLEKINQISDNNLKELTIFLVDDLLSQIHGENWFEYLIEKKILFSCIGGELFFDRLNYFIDTQNKEMLLFYCFAIKFGFKGKFNYFPSSIYSRCIHNLDLNIHDANIKNNFMYVTQRQTKNKYLLTFVIIFLIFLICIWNILEIFILKSLSKDILSINEVICF